MKVTRKRAILIVLEIMIIVFLINNFGFAYVSGRSMEPSLYSGDLIFYSKLANYSEGSIIIFDSDSFDRLLIKRIHKIENDSGGFFVLGDNLDYSEDSRNPLVGVVDEKDVVGKVMIRVFPLKKWGIVGG